MMTTLLLLLLLLLLIIIKQLFSFIDLFNTKIFCYFLTKTITVRKQLTSVNWCQTKSVTQD